MASEERSYNRRPRFPGALQMSRVFKTRRTKTIPIGPPSTRPANWARDFIN